MGITGLLPFLEKKTARKVSVQEFSGGTAAVDTYCWLHKGIFTCADKLAMGVQTDGYVTYCMNYVNLLLKNKIKPILVFDGRHLPAKAETELKRREQRDGRRKRASELMKMGEVQEARTLLKRSIDVSHEMALEVIKKCQEINVDCIVAPYEADAQLAYLNISGIADFVITEDSDLTLFGCTKILFKMDKFGNGTLVEQDRIYLSMSIRQDDFDIEKFRHMCILSGCDYLPSLPGVGLVKALKFAQKNTDDDIYKALGRLSTFINKKLDVTHEYREAFIRALITFKHQLVYCPMARKQVRLNPAPADTTAEQLHYAGDPVDEELAYQLALGNCNPFGFKKLNDFDPDKRSSLKLKKTKGWHESPSLQHPSIWSSDFKVKAPVVKSTPPEITNWPDTLGQRIVMNTKTIKEKLSPVKQSSAEAETSMSGYLKRSAQYLDEDLGNEDMIKLYGSNKIPKTREIEEKKVQEVNERRDERMSSPTTSPKKFNPFLKKPALSETSPSLVPRGRRRMKRTLIAFQPTIIDETIVTQSKFFSSAGPSKEDVRKAVIIPETQDIESQRINLERINENSGKLNVVNHVIIPETQDDEETIPFEMKSEVVKKGLIIPESPNDDEIKVQTFVDNSDNREKGDFENHHKTRKDVVIPESPEELTLSQASCKENDNMNSSPKAYDKETSIPRSDSGVDMKEDTTDKNNLNDFSDEIENDFSVIEKRGTGLNIMIKKYGLKSSEESISRVSSLDDFDEFVGSTEPIDNLRNTFFKWSNKKNNEKSINFLSNQSVISQRTSLKRNSSQNSIMRTKRPQVSKKLPQIDSQQSLLNMFGFKKNSNLKG